MLGPGRVHLIGPDQGETGGMEKNAAKDAIAAGIEMAYLNKR